MGTIAETFDVIAFDGDDTLWHNERLFVEAQGRFRDLLSAFHSPDWIDARLAEAEKRNLPHFGYGIKGFALSMIETAIDLTEERIASRDIRRILDIARGMLDADVQLLEHVRDTLARVGGTHRLMLITKGDLHDQERKVARSGIGHHFGSVEVVSEKDPAMYAGLLGRHGIPPDRFLMVGNSLRSDVLPVLEVGASAVHIPYELTWDHEVADPPPSGHPRFHTLAHIGLLPELLQEIEARVD
jgi:putative hydrolase of the HAD superfamily